MGEVAEMLPAAMRRPSSASRNTTSPCVPCLRPDDLRLAERRKHLPVEQLIAQPPIEALDVAVLPRAAVLDSRRTLPIGPPLSSWDRRNAGQRSAPWPTARRSWPWLPPRPCRERGRPNRGRGV